MKEEQQEKEFWDEIADILGHPEEFNDKPK